MYPLIKKYILVWLITSSLLLSGCGSSSWNTVTVGNYTFTLPTTFQTVSASSLDNAQIEHNIIAAWKSTEDDDKQSLVLSESSLPTSVPLKDFAQDTQTRLAQNMIGYTDGKLTTTSFYCNDTKVAAYKHSFVQTDIKDKTKIIQYYDQFYYTQNRNVYILSLAHQTENSILSDIIESYGCKAK